MVSKSEDKVAQLKGKDAEDAILKYLKKANRPYGSSDISANLKNAVSKAATQKILLALSEKQAITQKTYGKATYFVAPQTAADAAPASQLETDEQELKSRKEHAQDLAAEVKRLGAELAKVRGTVTDEELEGALVETQTEIDLTERALEPLRAGQAPVSESDLVQLDADWVRWRGEWVRRKRWFKLLWDMQIDSMSKDAANELQEDLAIELDTPEHIELEQSELCTKAKLRSK